MAYESFPVFVSDQVNEHEQVQMAGDQFLHSRERLQIRKEESVPSPHGLPCKRRDETSSTPDFSDIDETKQDRLVCQNQNAMERHRRDSYVNDGSLSSDLSEDEIDS